MTEPPPNEDDDVDEQYRRASARDASRPSESVRRAVLRHAAELAAQRAARGGPVGERPARELGPVNHDFKQPAANESRWRPAAYGGLAAAALAGLLIAPHFLPPATQPPSSSAQAVLSASKKTEAAPMARIEAPQAAPAEAMPAPAAPAVAARARELPYAMVAPRDQAAPAPAGEPLAAAPPQVVASGTVNALTAARARAPVDSATALRQAAQGGDGSRLKALLDEQIDVDARDPAGRTALMLAVIGGQAQAVDALLARGADPNAADSSGTTPLAAARAANRADIVAALRRAGAR